MTECTHEEFEAVVTVRPVLAEDQPVLLGRMASVQVTCGSCHMPFRFVGVPVGIAPSTPRTEPGGTTLHAPISPIDQLDPPGGQSAGFTLLSIGPERRN